MYFSGAISTIKALDYESTAEYNLIVKITALQSTATSTLTVKVTNLNEPHSINLPNSLTLSVLEISQNTEACHFTFHYIIYLHVFHTSLETRKLSTCT